MNLIFIIFQGGMYFTPHAGNIKSTRVSLMYDRTDTNDIHYYLKFKSRNLIPAANAENAENRS